MEVPSWDSLLGEVDHLCQQFRLLNRSCETLGPRLRRLRQEAELAVRLELAQGLLLPNGGVLALLLAMRDHPEDVNPKEAALFILDQLMRLLDLQPEGESGQVIELTEEECREYEVLSDSFERDLSTEKEAYVVIRPGWRLGQTRLACPVIMPLEKREF